MLLERWVIGLVIIVAILNPTIGDKLISARFGADRQNNQEYDYEQRKPYYAESHTYQAQKQPSLLYSFTSGLRKIFPRLPSERQGFGGVLSAIQTAAVPLAAVALGGAMREQILSALTTTTTTTAATTTIADYCSGVDCAVSGKSGTCDTTTGECKCGVSGACGTNILAPRCASSSATNCGCGDTGAACSGTGNEVYCAEYATATGTKQAVYSDFISTGCKKCLEASQANDCLGIGTANCVSGACA